MLFIFHCLPERVPRILIELPVSVLMAFILMKQFGITSNNIMKLQDLAIAIGGAGRFVHRFWWKVIAILLRHSTTAG